MSEFLLEIYSEEIPARMQSKAADDFKRIFLEYSQKENIKIDETNIKAFISSRRISILIDKIDKFQIFAAIQKVGPKIGANQKAVDGFAVSVGTVDATNLQIIKNDKGEYYAFNKKESKIATAEIFKKNLPLILQKMSNLWPKTMRWQSGKIQSRWVRPIRSILAIFDGKVINFEFSQIKSGNKTYGHNLLSKKALEISSFKDYQSKLEKNFVIINQDNRREKIINEINKICKSKNIKLTDELNNKNHLLDEAVGLAEFPTIAIGEIDKDFMSLPKEVLILTAKLHQKYFCVQDKKGKLAPYFIFVSNVKINKRIILDNQKVLRARLSDAKFFIDEDLKVPFDSRIEDLKNIIFHEKLGTIHDKVKRLEVFNKFIALWIPNSNLILAERLADMAKNDLTTKCVAELPELQGVIGGYYAKIQGEDDEVSKAVSEQYLPIGPESNVPQTPLGSLLAISDKIDTICGLFLVGQRPTGSKDPFALRRSALGIVRIIIHNNISIPLRIIVEKSISGFPIKILKKRYPKVRGKEFKQIKIDILHDIIEFIAQRIKSILKDYYNVKPDITNVLFDDCLHKIKEDKKFDINKLVKKAIFINDFIADKSNSDIISLYKRAANIVTIEEKKDKRKYDSKPHPLSMKDKYEKDLYKKTKLIASKTKKLYKVGDYKEIFKLLQELKEPLNNFFDNVKINVDDIHIRENRLLILGRIKTLFNYIFDFSKIEK